MNNNWTDYYKVLGLTKDATDEEIRKKYKELVRKYHPDVCKDADATERAAEINVAYDTLSDKNKRAEYDRNYEECKKTGKSSTHKKTYRPYDYEEKMKNYSEREKKYSKQLALEKIVRKALEKVEDIKRIKYDLLISTIENEDYSDNDYVNNIEEWWTLSEEYIDKLNKLIDKTTEYEMSFMHQEIKDVQEKLKYEMEVLPLSVIEARKYVNDIAAKEEMLEQINNDLILYRETLRRIQSIYKKIDIGTINKDNYKEYYKKCKQEISKAKKVFKNMTKAIKLFKLDENLNKSIEELTISFNQLEDDLPKSYEEAKTKCKEKVNKHELDLWEEELEKLIMEFQEDIKKIKKNKFDINNIYIFLDAKGKYNVVHKKGKELIDLFEYSLVTPEKINNDLKQLTKYFSEVKDKSYYAIKELFDLFISNSERSKYSSILINDTLGYTGANIVAGFATIGGIFVSNRINKEAIKYSIPAVTISLFIATTAINGRKAIKKHHEYLKEKEKYGNIIASDDYLTKEFEKYKTKSYKIK